jgi:hypothetical protein
VDEQQQEMQPWRWPERPRTGTASAHQSQLPPADQSPSSQELEPSTVPDSGLDQLPGESARSVALRSTLITLVSTAISTAASFGMKLDEAQSTAVISLVTTAAALVALVASGRRRG